jgi:hypothetical protein
VADDTAFYAMEGDPTTGASGKYPRTLHFPFSPGAKNDDRIARDYASLIGPELVITEKLDGENTCLNACGVFSRSHAAPTQNPWATYLYPRWHQLKRDLGGLDLFGESLYGIHSIEYTGLPEHFFLFGVRCEERWESWDTVRLYSELASVPAVPVLWRGRVHNKTELQALIEELVQQPSALSDPELGLSPREGVVIRRSEAFTGREFETSVMKWVRRGHVQTDEFWARNWRRAPLRHELRARAGLEPVL